jgi:glycerol-3-phosphate dehydrogenase
VREVEVLAREQALQRAAESALDVIVVGAGITGAGVALDAAMRGYRVALVDREDVAAGTSSRSSKLVHGGLRYLATGDLRMVAEGVRERDRTRRMAPHLVLPLAFALARPSRASERALLKLGLGLYDLLAGGRTVARHDDLSPEALRATAPTLRAGGRGGHRYWDARTDDARLTLAVVRAATDRGVLAITHTSVDDVLVDRSGRARGVVVTDALTGERATWRARWVVAAGGVWAGALADLVPDGRRGPSVRPARGAHLVLPRDRLPVDSAVVFPSATGDGRRLFAVPWGRQVYVGTNDVPGDDLTPVVTASDVEYLLAALDGAFVDAPRRAEVVAGWAGLRPLAGEGEDTASLSRRHVVVEAPAGLVHVTGGKLTTWRAMAEDVVDRLVAADGRRVPCRTVGVPLGSVGSLRAGLARAHDAGTRLGLDGVASAALHHRHGDRAPLVMAACAAEEHGTEPLVDGLPYLRGEVRWAVRHELARTVDDVLSRRTRVAVRARDAGVGVALEHVLDVLDEEIGLGDRDAARIAYLDRVASERGALPGPPRG